VVCETPKDGWTGVGAQSCDSSYLAEEYGTEYTDGYSNRVFKVGA
jgi:hypothetical protein